MYITEVKIETEKQCESISKKSGTSYNTAFTLRAPIGFSFDL